MPNRIVWTNEEKNAIVSRAADELKGARDEGIGLRLIRSAMAVLPANRRRKLIALSQAPWFEGMVESELMRRAKLGGHIVEDPERLAGLFPCAPEGFEESTIAMMALIYREVRGLRDDVIANRGFFRDMNSGH